jgi:dolichol-phosphate mannosyltransferase
MLLSVIAPMYNEALSIGEFLKQTLEVLAQHFSEYELILVDDGSIDTSIEVASAIAAHHPQVRILELSRNYGKEIATSAGLKAAKGDNIVLMDSDLQNPPQLIPELYQKMQQGFDVVYAERQGRVGESFIKKVTSRMFYWLACKMTGFKLESNAGDFRIMSRQVVNAINSLPETNRYLVMLYAYVGFKSGSVPYVVPPRFAGERSYKYTALLKAAFDAILSFSSAPLRIISILSVCVSAICACYAGFIFIQHMMANNLVDGLASVLCFMAIMFALLFLFLALLSEYIGRIMAETKRRPLYFIRREINAAQSDCEG